MKVTLVACVLLEQGGRYLLVQQAAGRRQPGLWGPPGGKPELDKGETLAEAAKCEVAEEIGHAVELTGLVGLLQNNNAPDFDLFVGFAGQLTNPADADNLQLKEGEISGARWLTLEEIEQAAVPMRATKLAALYRQHQAGKVYPLETVQNAID